MTATWKAIGQIIPDAKSSYKQIHEDDNLKAVEFHLFVFFGNSGNHAYGK